MRISIRKIIFLTLIFNSLVGYCDSDALIDHAVFADMIESTEVPLKRGVGIESQIFGYGAIYTQEIKPNMSWSLIGRYFSKHQIFINEFAPSEMVAAVEHSLDKGFGIAIGGNYTLHLTNNKYWGLLGGVDVGYYAMNYTTKYYPKLCGILFCGFNPNVEVKRSEVKNFVRSDLTVGVGFVETEIFGVVGDLKLLVSTPLISTEKETIGPDGREYETAQAGALVFQGIVNF